MTVFLNLALFFQFQFVDIDSDKPLVRIGNQVFVGEWRDTLGSSVFFSKTDEPSASDPVFGNKPGKCLHYEQKTAKKLVLKRVFLNKKVQNSQNEASSVAAEEKKGSN